MIDDRRVRQTAIEPIGALRRWAVGACLVVLAVGQLASPTASVDAATPFTDIAGTPFEQDIEWLYAEGITTGCNPTLYCPDAKVRRDEMASFLARMFDLPPAPGGADYFTDDDANIHEDNINRVAAAGITLGCSTDYYCPHDAVRRDQIASFLARAIPLTAGGDRDYFRDDNANPHEPNIDQIAAAGIGSGCGVWRYCPDWTFTRGQMAAFLHRVEVPLGAVLPYPAPPPGLTFYTATTGTNSGNDCLTPATPCRTVKYAIDQTIGGDTVRIGPGTFAEPPLVLLHKLALIGDGGSGTTIDVASSAAPAVTITGTGPVSIDRIDLHSAGGGIEVKFQFTGELSVTDSTITGTCTTCDGVYGYGYKLITNSTISGYRHGIINSSTITNTTITGNAGNGVSGGYVKIANSTISGNGGIGVAISGNSAIAESTIVDSAIDGNGHGGVQLSMVNVTIANSTITGNTTPFEGGGIFTLSSTAKVVNSTITANTSAGAGAGIRTDFGTLLLTNTIIAGNTRLVTGAADEVAGFGQELASIVGVPGGLTLDDIFDPAGLADHGGPTETIALTDSPSNPALDTGDAATCAAAPINGLDQRGLPRTPPCDLGAYELQP